MRKSAFAALAFAFAVASLAAATMPLDEGEWPAVLPVCKTPSPRIVDGVYFRGRMICPSKDGQGEGAQEFMLRRTVSLKAKPTEAWVQFIGVRSAVLRLNGKAVTRNGYWPNPTVREVGGFLKTGMNEIVFDCVRGTTSSGVLAELFIRYPDGTHERIDTDSSFRASDDGGKTWGDVLEQMPPPAKPWHRAPRLAYTDFAHLQHFVSGAVEPGETVAGDKVVVRLEFDGPVPAMPLDIGIEIRRDGGAYWREDVTVGKECLKVGTDGGWTLRFPYELPQYLSEGRFDLAVASGLSCVSGTVAKASFTCHRAAMPEKFAKPPCADVRMVAGAPQFHVGGKPIFALWGAVCQRNHPDTTLRHSSAPLSIVTVFSRSSGSDDEWWPSTDGFAPAVFDRQAEQARRDNGDDAYFMWDFALYPPPDWVKSHPDELCLDDMGEQLPQGRTTFSFASKSALDAMERALVKALHYLESAPYANRIIGYRINSGHYTEWVGWFAKQGRFVDFSPPARKAFAEYVKKHHPEWNDASVPSAAERISGDSLARARCAAYHEFYSRQVADDVIRLMCKAREIVGRGKLLGTYHGYVMTCNSRGDGQMRAHYAVKHLLEAGVVDFLMSPQQYSERRLGGICCDMKPFATLTANGVVPVIENDVRTSNGPYNGDNGQTLTRVQDIGILRRDAGTMLCRRQPVLFYALCEGTEFDFPEFAADMAGVRKVAEHCLTNGVERHAEVAYVVSETACRATQPLKRKNIAAGFARQRYTPEGSVKNDNIWYMPGFTDVFRFNHTTLARAGAPIDYVLAEDLVDHPGSYKLYIEPDILAGKMRFRTAEGVSEGDTLLKVDVLRDLYAEAGVQVYSRTGDPVDANDRLFTLHARFAGVKDIKLPRKTTVLDVFNRRIVAKDVDTFTFYAPLHSSWLFYCGDDAEMLATELNR